MKLLEENKQSLVDMHHGKILWDLSPSENQNTVYFVTLPNALI